MLKQKFEEVPWTTKQTFVGVAVTIISFFALTALLSLLNSSSGSTPHQAVAPSVDIVNAVVTFIIDVILEGIFFLAPLYYASRLTARIQPGRRSIWDTLGFRHFNVWRTLPLIIGCLIGIIVLNEAYQLLITTFHLPLQTNSEVVLRNSKILPITTYATLVAATFVAPFFEEVFFRSFTFMGLLRDMTLPVAVIFSALIFAAAHGDPGSFPILLIIGVALAFLRWRTRSIWPGFILHLLNNGLSAILVILAMHGIPL